MMAIYEKEMTPSYLWHNPVLNLRKWGLWSAGKDLFLSGVCTAGFWPEQWTPEPEILIVIWGPSVGVLGLQMPMQNGDPPEV